MKFTLFQICKILKTKCETQVTNSIFILIVTGNYEKSKLQPFLRDYLTNESRVLEAKLILENLLESANTIKRKLKEAVDEEDNKFEEIKKEEKDMKKTLLNNIHKGKTKSKILKNKRRNTVVQNMSMVHPGHENFNLVFNIMLGIKKAIEAVIDFPLFELQKKDFKIK